MKDLTSKKLTKSSKKFAARVDELLDKKMFDAELQSAETFLEMNRDMLTTATIAALCESGKIKFVIRDDSQFTRPEVVKHGSGVGIGLPASHFSYQELLQVCENIEAGNLTDDVEEIEE